LLPLISKIKTEEE
jgi:ATP-dependent RNA helicase DeaD